MQGPTCGANVSCHLEIRKTAVEPSTRARAVIYRVRLPNTYHNVHMDGRAISCAWARVLSSTAYRAASGGGLSDDIVVRAYHVHHSEPPCDSADTYEEVKYWVV